MKLIRDRRIEFNKEHGLLLVSKEEVESLSIGRRGQPKEEEWITVSQAAGLKGVKRDAIYKLIKRGKLNPIKKHDRLLVSKIEVRNLK